MQTQTTHKETSFRKSLWQLAGRAFGGIAVLIGMLYAGNNAAGDFAPTSHSSYGNVDIAESLYYASDMGADNSEGDEFPCPPCD